MSVLVNDSISSREAAKLLDTSLSSICRYIAQGRLRAYKIGQAWRIAKADVTAMRAQDGAVSLWYDQPCWTCMHALRGTCSWANPDTRKPVEGWTAEPAACGSYAVICCPMYEYRGRGADHTRRVRI